MINGDDSAARIADLEEQLRVANAALRAALATGEGPRSDPELDKGEAESREAVGDRSELKSGVKNGVTDTVVADGVGSKRKLSGAVKRGDAGKVARRNERESCKHCDKDHQGPCDVKDIRCRKCNELGHYAGQCGRSKKGKGEGCKHCKKDHQGPCDIKDIKCRLCGKVGHYAGDCKGPRKGKEITCYKCGEEGHIANGCPNPPKTTAAAARAPGQAFHMNAAKRGDV